MLIGILVVVWVIVLSPLAIRHFRETQSERSIVTFREKMDRIGSGTPLVAPAHRLGVSDEAPPRPVEAYEADPPTRAPHLRVVPSNATVAELESDLSWREWSLAHSDDPREVASARVAARVRANPRAAAYARVPAAPIERPAPPIEGSWSRTARARRRRTLLQLVGAAVVLTLAAAFMDATILVALAAAAWVALAGFLGLMYYAMTNGLINASLERPVNPARAPIVVRATAPLADEALEVEGDYSFRRDERYAQAL